VMFSAGRELEPLIAQDRVEVRVFDSASDHTLIRAGDQILLTLPLPTEGGYSPALLHQTAGCLTASAITSDCSQTAPTRPSPTSSSWTPTSPTMPPARI
jgi:hypothetical protein